jgi:hypothetical protein
MVEQSSLTNKITNVSDLWLIFVIIKKNRVTNQTLVILFVNEDCSTMNLHKNIWNKLEDIRMKKHAISN